MWSHRRSRRRELELEATLRGHRTEPRDEYVRTLLGRMGATHVRRPRAWSRVAFAGAVSTLILGMFASVGGLEYTAFGATATYRVAKQIAVKHKLVVSVHSSAADQYKPPVTKIAAKHKTHKKGPSVAVATAGASKTLPFTGLSLLTTVAVSLGLILVGLALRRRERRN